MREAILRMDKRQNLAAWAIKEFSVFTIWGCGGGVAAEHQSSDLATNRPWFSIRFYAGEMQEIGPESKIGAGF